MVDDPVGHASVEHDELRKEGYTMGLYVAVCLVAALTAVDDHADSHLEVFGLVWGTAIGLALAHLFAFRVAARLVAGGKVPEHDVAISVAQLAGAAVVAAVCTVPILLLPAADELDAVRWVLAGLIGATAFMTARSADATRLRAAVYAVGVFAVACAVALVKNLLGH